MEPVSEGIIEITAEELEEALRDGLPFLYEPNITAWQGRSFAPEEERSNLSISNINNKIVFMIIEIF